MLENIEYLPLKNEFRIGDVKNLAVMTNQKDAMQKSFPKVETSTVSNADMLSQSFSGNMAEPSKTETITEPVQVTAIPNVQNGFNMEANPVDLNVNTVTQPNMENITMPTIDNLPQNEISSIPSVPVIEPINSVSSIPVSSNPIQETNGFKVTNEPNIFDNPITEPFAISQEDINKPLDNNVVSSNVPEINVFNQPINASNDLVKEESIDKEVKVENSINEDIVLAQIAIEESNVKHYEALAENSKKKIELLKRQVKTSGKNEEQNLENTASNLFNSNGILDEEKVLGKTPMPNIAA